MSATQQALDGLVTALSAAADGGKVSVLRPGDTPSTEGPDVLVTPLSLTRIGRSRRAGSLLDLELTVAVEAGGDNVLDLAEKLLLAAEATPHARLEPLPADRSGFGFVVAVTVSVAIAEPTGPPVRERVVQVQPLVAVTGTVVDPDGVALGGVEVRSSLTRQQTTTDTAGRFALAGLAVPDRKTSLTISRGARTATVEVPADPTGLRLILPNHEGG
jgi:hypothetical protein